MQRRLATKLAIRTDIQLRIHASSAFDGECKKCRVPGVIPLSEPDETECNWVAENTFSGPKACIDVVAAIIEEVRRRYNLAD
jgi:hypothetical protein